MRPVPGCTGACCVTRLQAVDARQLHPSAQPEAKPSNRLGHDPNVMDADPELLRLSDAVHDVIYSTVPATREEAATVLLSAMGPMGREVAGLAGVTVTTDARLTRMSAGAFLLEELAG
jgi:hypothetical protein